MMVVIAIFLLSDLTVFMLTPAVHNYHLEGYTSSSGRHAGAPPGAGRELHCPEEGENTQQAHSKAHISRIKCKGLKEKHVFLFNLFFCRG